MLNLAYSLDADGNVKSREATAEELEKYRKIASDRLAKDRGDWEMRSCWNCNMAHSRFLENLNDGFLFQCVMGCGKWYYQGVDITT